jgi:hypothetical protein
MKKLLLSLAIFVLFNTCTEKPGFFDPTYLGEGFKGITFTLEDPTPLGGDMSDWCYSFNIYKGNIEIPPPTKFALYPAYPNPSVLGDTLNIIFSLPARSGANLYIMNKDQQVITVIANETLDVGNYYTGIDVRTIGAGVYRVVFESGDFYCTGDVWIKSKR